MKDKQKIKLLESRIDALENRVAKLSSVKKNMENDIKTKAKSLFTMMVAGKHEAALDDKDIVLRDEKKLIRISAIVNLMTQRAHFTKGLDPHDDKLKVMREVIDQLVEVKYFKMINVNNVFYVRRVKSNKGK